MFFAQENLKWVRLETPNGHENNYKDQPLELYPIPIIFHHFPVIFEEWNDSNSGIL